MNDGRSEASKKRSNLLRTFYLTAKSSRGNYKTQQHPEKHTPCWIHQVEVCVALKNVIKMFNDCDGEKVQECSKFFTAFSLGTMDVGCFFNLNTHTHVLLERVSTSRPVFSASYNEDNQICQK